MLAQYRPELRDAVTTNQPGTQGDGIKFAQAVGADTVDIDQIQVHPTVEQTTATLLSENIRGDGAILVNTDGERFTNELLTRDRVSEAEWRSRAAAHSQYSTNRCMTTTFPLKRSSYRAG